jgi:hypothetical protein
VLGYRTVEKNVYRLGMFMYPITCDTPAKLHFVGHKLAVHCEPCVRWADVDLKAMIERGQGDRRFEDMRPRCSGCGQVRKWQVR